MIRAAAVSGQFYPGNKNDLRQEVQSYIHPEVVPRQAIGVVSPHAGYVYSGAIAGEALSAVTIPDEVIILGPNHRGLGHPGAVFAKGAWQTPLGEVRVAERLATELLNSCSELLAEDTVAHRQEHSLEVQVPFIQTIKPDVKIVPICLSHWPLEQLIVFGERLASVVASRQNRPLILASSDMSHYEPGEIARAKDQLAIDRVLDLDPEGLYSVVRQNRISMCGVIPTVVLLAAARALNAEEVELVRYGNSGDITGDQSEVVGYAGLTVY